MGTEELGKNIKFPIYNSDGTPFHNLEIYKSSVDSVVMSLSDKISGDVYYKDNTLDVTMGEYITYNGVNYILVNPPTIVREGMASDNGELKGMTKYSFVFYHPMCLLGNFPFCDVAVTSDQTRYLGESKSFSWVGYPDDYIAKLNKNLVGTEWIVEKSPRFPQDKESEMSPVLPFANNTIADALKIWYDTWGLPYIIDVVSPTEQAYAQGKRFKVVMGLASNEIYASNEDEALGRPFVFQMGQGVGLKNNSRTPRNNKIVTRIAGCGSENNIPYGYPQIRWFGTSGLEFTYGDHAGVYNNVTIGGHTFTKVVSYPIYKGILGGAYVELINHPFTRKNLMPLVYRSCLFNKISFLNTDGTPNLNYNPDIELVDYYDAIYSKEYPYPNQINPQAPSYESHTFEDIKPELGEAQIVSATPLNKDLTPASSWDDSIDDDGNYNQSYFQIVLPQLPFDIYACAAITEEMQISMRTGACIGCTFPVQVDWDDYKRNFYDENGNFAPNGEQRDLTKYPKSNEGQIALILQKEDSTFGTLMPNMYQYPVSGDGFVVLGISLPESYITDAESNLDGEMKSYMLENNVYYFDYPLKFDEAFLATHTHILSQIRPNTIIHFKYANEDLALSVKQITVRYGESQLPKYDITLTDNVEVVLNQIGRVAEDVEKLSTLIAILRQSYGRNVWSELAKKLSKTQDDTAAGFITMLKGLQIGANFVPDILGEGGVLRMREDGKVELVTDILYARVKAYFDSVEIREYQHTGGNRIASVAGNKICRVAWFNSSNVELEQTQANLASVAYFRCYFRASDGEDTVRNNWVIGDQAYCHITSITTSSDNPEQKGLNQKHLWRLVIGRNTEGTLTEDGEAYIDLSNRATETISGTSYTGYQSGSDIPEAQDDIIQLGNVNDTTRQGAIVEFVTGTDAPSYQIYQGINSFSLNNKNQIGFGYNTSTGRAYMNVYGDFRFGARPNTQGSYLEYNSQTGTLNIKAHVEFTNTDQELDTLVQNHQRDDSYDDTEVRGLISGLQEQIDGQIETWFYNYSPVNVDASGAPTSNVPLNVAPYSDWTTDNDKIAHLGDTFTNNSTGYCWRFSRNSSTNAFEWVIIEDSAVITALQNAARAQDTADHKRRVFICDSSHQTPTPPYDAGDLWVNVKYPWATGATYNDEILKCVTSKASGSFAIADWSLANGYTAKLNNFVNNTYSPFAQNIQTQVDKKAETWRQATNPATSWTTEAEKAKHVGDLWMDTANGKKTYIYQNTAAAGATPVYDWVAQDVPDEVFDKIDGKAAIYVGWEDWIVGDVSQLKDKDLYIPNTDHNPYKANKVYRWRASDSTWNEISYTDDTAFNNYINAFLNGTGASGDSATAAAIQKAIAGALGSGTIVDGGLLLTSLIGMRKNIGTTESPVYETWAGISGQYDDWSGNTHAKGHGIAAWYGGAMVDKEDVQTLPASYAKSLFRFDGSGYLANGNITWGESGALSIANLSSLTPSGSDTNLLNAMIQFNNAFHFTTHGVSPNTYITINPQASFERLFLYDSQNPNTPIPVASQKWVGDNYISKAWFNNILKVHYTQNDEEKVLSPNEDFPQDATDKTLESVFSFWTNYGLTALGKGIDGTHVVGVLDDLNDVTISDPQTNQVLKYNGTQWVNAAAPSGASALSGLTDVAISSLADKDLLQWDYASGKWKNVVLSTVMSAYALASSIPTNVSQLNNDSGYITSAALSGYATESWVCNNYLPLTGGTITGLLNVGSNMSQANAGRAEIHLVSTTDIPCDLYLGNAQTNYWSISVRGSDENNILSLWSSYASNCVKINHNNGYVACINSVEAASFIKTNGTSSQFLKADGSVDSNTYALNSSLGNYLPLSGGTITGGILSVRPTGGNYTDGIRIHARSQDNSWAALVLCGAENTGDTGTSENTWFIGAEYGNLCFGRNGTGEGFGGSANLCCINNVWYINGSAIAVTSQIPTNNNQLTNGAGYITGITSSMVTGALGYTPANSASLSNYLPLTGGILTSDLYINASSGRSTFHLTTRSDNPCDLWLGANERDLWSINCRASNENYKLSIYSTEASHVVGIAHSTGNVGIGTEPSSYKLSVNSSARITKRLTIGYDVGTWSETRAEFELITEDADANDMWLGSNAQRKWGISCRATSEGSTLNFYNANISLAFQMSQNGDFYATGGVTALSDERHKNIVENTRLQVSDIARMRAVRYLWNDGREDNGMHVGSIAQDWQQILPEVVLRANNDEGTLSLQYGVAALISSITIARKVVNHEERITALERENADLKRAYSFIKNAYEQLMLKIA